MKGIGMEIYPGVFMIKGMASRQYLIDNDREIVLIDTGLSMDHKRIKKAILDLSEPSLSISMILITHADGDHYGGVNSLRKDYPNAIVRSSRIEAEAMKQGISSRKIQVKGIKGIFFNVAGKFIRSEPSNVIGDLQPGMELPILGGLQVMDTSGHTPGHLSFYLKEHGVLFAGDSILVHGAELVPSTGANTWDLNKARESFDRQIALDPVVIAGGHGWIKRK
jgi:glyoxylase-like metal-dependent hydrolase (beta-lactamase superfamily II)